jgi:hypothetical protein
MLFSKSFVIATLTLSNESEKSIIFVTVMKQIATFLLYNSTDFVQSVKDGHRNLGEPTDTELITFGLKVHGYISNF